MNRRKLLKSLGAGATLAMTGTAAGKTGDRQVSFNDADRTLALEDARFVKTASGEVLTIEEYDGEVGTADTCGCYECCDDCPPGCTCCCGGDC
ncbi:hypothetical protein NGM10_08210 [Halorussus salilacus]|uniref:hypothetical protein n=1 Tax=Halorussus salilacus TaxID=2953750 RepID=UPI00209DE274|nr:hypothetical protein [Halorussus salilacus]USZ66725.1 hypothetical protein NGM10_08210 [Halorussus salilacus]